MNYEFYIFELLSRESQDFVVVTAPTKPIVVSASRTADGAPVYLTVEGVWSRALDKAQVVDGDGPQPQALLEAARKQEAQICDPYTFPVTVEAGAAVAVSTRERIRSQGPTTPLRRHDKLRLVRHSA